MISSNKIRNIAIVAHVDHGKTSLTAAITKVLAKKGQAQEKKYDDTELKKFFTPEFRNRLDGIVKFNKLTKENIAKIVNKIIAEINDLLSDKEITLTLTKTAVNYIIQEGYDSKMGARPLSRKIDELIRIPLSKKILFDRLSDCTVHAVMNKDQLEFIVEEPAPKALPMVNEDGLIVLDQFKPKF